MSPTPDPPDYECPLCADGHHAQIVDDRCECCGYDTTFDWPVEFS